MTFYALPAEIDAIEIKNEKMSNFTESIAEKDAEIEVNENTMNIKSMK